VAETVETESLRYDKWVEEALRDVIRRALRQAATSGLPGEHHFFITFQTENSGVEMPASLRAEHSNEMTIVLQHQFEDLIVEPNYFALTLSFSGRPSRLVIPFSAVTSFADPSVNFGLQLKMMPFNEDEQDGVENAIANLEPALDDISNFDKNVDDDNDDDALVEDEEPDKMGEVIALDAFRKK